MKNINKAIAAGALGVALLAGTAGTFATWSDSENLNVGNIVTGNLGVTLGWANGWQVRTANGQVAVTGALQNHTFVPGQSAWRNLRITPELVGLTINDVTITTDKGTMNLDENGYVLNSEGQPTALRFEIITRPAGDWMHLNPELRVTFVRSAELGMYDYDDTFDLGEITVTVTQR